LSLGAVNETLTLVLFDTALADPIVGTPGTVVVLPAKPMAFKLPAARVIIVGIDYLAFEYLKGFSAKAA
jgi:hypothetical protein